VKDSVDEQEKIFRDPFEEAKRRADEILATKL
jgi:hypothetical protein